MNTLRSILEALARDTWERLQDARKLSIRFGEETITDLLLLDLRRRKPEAAEFIQTSKFHESTSGTDFEWWLGSDRIGWLRFAVQAKKLDLITGRYAGFTHEVNGELQIDLLEKYAMANHATALYCLYNHSTDLDASRHWHCCQTSFEPEQLGCTITPSSVVRDTLWEYGTKNFDYVHGIERTIPWRCLALCPRIRRHFDLTKARAITTSSDDSLSVFDDEPHRYSQLPDSIRRGRETGRLVEFDDDAYDPDVGWPRRIFVLEFSPEEEGDNR